MAGIISVADFTRNTAKLTDYIPGRRTHSYNRVLRHLEKYHNSSDRGNWKEFLLLQALYRVADAYKSSKQTSRSKGIDQLIQDIELRRKALTDSVPMINWPQFDPATLRAGQPSNESEYDYQVIIQLENDPIVHKAVQRLTTKNPEKTLIVQLDINNGNDQLVYGDPRQLSGNNVRWVLVGHGEAPQGFISQYMSGFTPQEVYIGVKKLKQKMTLSPPKRIVLLGCRLGNNTKQQGSHNSFAQNFIRAMYADNKTSPPLVRAYSAGMMVNSEGRRTSITYPVPTAQIPWLQETKHRVDLQWNHGLLRTNHIPVILFVINDIFNKKITLDQAIKHYSDILAYCFKTSRDDVIDKVLLKQVVENVTDREQFIIHIMKSAQDPKRWQGSGYLRDALTHSRPPGEPKGTVIASPSSATVPVFTYRPISYWEKDIPAAMSAEGTAADDSANDYDYQIIIQFEGEQQLHQNIEKLIARQPGNSLVIQYDALTKESRLIYGDPQAVQGSKVGWLLAGYCRSSALLFSGITPSDLSNALNKLRLNYALKLPVQIVLAAKNSADFGMQLSSAMQHQTFYAPVRAYRAVNIINIAGLALTPGDTADDLWLAKNSYFQVNYTKAKSGPVMVNAVPAALFIMDDMYIGTLPVSKAIQKYADILQYYFPTPDNKLDTQLVADTVGNYSRYAKFANYIGTTLANPDSRKTNFSSWLTATPLSARATSEENNKSNDSHDIRLEPLAKRIHNTRMIMDNLATGSIKLTELNRDERRYLSDFFPCPDGMLDSKRLMLTLASERDLRAFYHDLHDLLQLADQRMQRNGLSGQAMLQCSKNWNNHLAENIHSLQQATDKNSAPGVTLQMRIALHTLYIHDGSPEAKRQAAGTSMAWLHTLSLGESDQQHFLNGLKTYTEINELKATESLSASEMQKSDKFHRLMNELSHVNYPDQNYVTNKGEHTLDTWLPQLTDNRQDGYFQLVADNHVFGLAKRTTGGQQNWYLYNPDLGEIHLTSKDPVQIIKTLKTLLYDYLNSKSDARNNQTLADHYGVQKSGEQLSFTIYQVNTADATKLPVLNSLQSLLSYNFSTERQRLKNSGNIKLGTLTLPRQILYEMGATLDGQRVSSGLNLAATDLNKLRFDPQILTHYLAATPPQDALPALRLLKKCITETRVVDRTILAPHKNANVATEAIQLLDKIEHHKGDEQQLSSQLPSLLNKPGGHHNRWQRINQITRYAGRATQGYSYFQALTTLSDYWQANNNKNSSPGERQELALQAGMALGQISLNAGEYGLGKLSQYLVNRGLADYGSRLGRLSFTSGIKLAKFGGLLLGIASSGFDIYEAWRYFSQAETAAPRMRQDMRVQGSLSVLSAAVGISTTLAIAAGGTIMTVGAAIGVLMGITIIIAGRVYAAARQIAAIKKYITLSPGEELRNGWLLFTGQDVDISVQNRLSAAHTREETRNIYTRLLKEQAETLLADSLSSKGIDTYFYSKGTFDLEEHTYKALMGGKRAPLISGELIKSVNMHYSSKGILQDRILPQQAEEISQTYNSMMDGDIPNYTGLSIEDSKYHFYVPTPLKAVQDNIKADHNHLAGGATKVVFQPPQEEGHQQQQMAALFDLHDDDDSVLGYQDKKNIFIVQAGQKQFSGGRLADIFLLMGQPAPFHASKLDGSQPSEDTTSGLSDNDDIVIAKAAPAGGVGYSIDLTKGEVRYLSDANPLVTRISHIEHASGHVDTNDILTGNGLNNALNGAGGLDKLYGNDGDDVLILADGYAEGGSGIDTYCILQNVRTQHASIRIKDAASKTEINNIRLHYKAEQINAIDLLPDDALMLILNNDNGTLTTLTLTNIYQLSDTDNQLNRINEYILYTLDGMVLFPQWPQTIRQDKQGKWPFSPQLIGQYNPLLDQRWQEKVGDKKPEQLLIKLQHKDSAGRGRITVGDTQMVLPSFIQLATEGTLLNDQLEGDNESNWLRGYQGNDHLTGKGGSDIYEIYESADQDKQRYKITIDNYDDYPSAVNQGEKQQPDIDFLLVKQPVNELALKQEGDDLILRSRILDSRLPEIHIRNFMSDKRNRHLMLIDKNGGNYSLQLDENKQPYLKDDLVQAAPSHDNDYIVLSALAGGTVDALAGDDVVVDKTGGGRILHGGPGNDVVVVSGGNNQLYGDEGDDQLYGGAESDMLNGGSGNDTLSGGPGNDILQDFRGDDLYLFSPGDAEDIIRDLYGTDRLCFLGDGLDKNSLWFKRQGDHLKVLVSAQDSGDNVRLEGYFTKSQDKASNTIEVAGYRLHGADITALTQVMSSFPAFEFKHPVTGAANLVQQNINKYWSAVTE